MSSIDLFLDDKGKFERLPKCSLEIFFDTPEKRDRWLWKQERYVWHDLRKNPDDFPEYNSDVLAINDKNEHMPYVTMGLVQINGNLYDARDFQFDVEKFMNKTFVDVNGDVVRVIRNKIIAWKYIEPFEEEDNE